MSNGLMFIAQYKFNKNVTFFINNAVLDNKGLDGDYWIYDSLTNIPKQMESGRWQYADLGKLELVHERPAWAQEKKKCYKVVYHRVDGFWSCWTKCTYYKLNEWVYPKPNTLLFVFDTITNARRYILGMSDCKIFECEIGDKAIYQNGAYFNHDYDRFWKTFNANGVVHQHQVPLNSVNGTILTDRVKLLREVK